MGKGSLGASPSAAWWDQLSSFGMSVTLLPLPFRDSRCFAIDLVIRHAGRAGWESFLPPQGSPLKGEGKEVQR